MEEWPDVLTEKFMRKSYRLTKEDRSIWGWQRAAKPTCARVTGSLRGDIEAAEKELLSIRDDGDPVTWMWAEREAAEAWHIFPEALEVFVLYQDPEQWDADFRRTRWLGLSV